MTVIYAYDNHLWEPVYAEAALYIKQPIYAQAAPFTRALPEADTANGLSTTLPA